MGIKRLCRCCCATRATEDKLPGGLPRWSWWTVGDFLVKDVDVECNCTDYHQITSHIKSLRRPRCRHYTFAKMSHTCQQLAKVFRHIRHGRNAGFCGPCLGRTTLLDPKVGSQKTQLPHVDSMFLTSSPKPSWKPG